MWAMAHTLAWAFESGRALQSHVDTARWLFEAEVRVSSYLMVTPNLRARTISIGLEFVGGLFFLGSCGHEMDFEGHDPKAV